MKYNTLKELKKAYDTGKLTEPLMIDNDCTFVYVDDKEVFNGGSPDHDLLWEALKLLGIPAESV